MNSNQITVTPKSDMLQLVTFWLGNKKRIRSNKTRQTYLTNINQFLIWSGTTNLDQINLAIAIEYRDYLIGKYAKTTAANKLATLKSFLGFMAKFGLFPSETIGMIRELEVEVVSKRASKDRSVSKDDVARLLKFCDSFRDETMMLLLASAGLRASELVGLDIADFDTAANTLSVSGKGNKQRIITVPARVAGMLRELIGDRHYGKIFLSKNGKPLARQDAFRLIKKLAKRAGVDTSISTHWLRHFFARDAIANGAPIHELSKTLGHSSIQITSDIYLEKVGNVAQYSSFS
jgi:integrase/recombinase XerD